MRAEETERIRRGPLLPSNHEVSDPILVHNQFIFLLEVVVFHKLPCAFQNIHPAFVIGPPSVKSRDIHNYVLLELRRNKTSPDHIKSRNWSGDVLEPKCPMFVRVVVLHTEQLPFLAVQMRQLTLCVSLSHRKRPTKKLKSGISFKK
jgi:hypothetical protein